MQMATRLLPAKTKSNNTFIERFHSHGQQLYKFIAARKYVVQRKRQLPQDWFGTPSWAPLHCFGTPILPKQVDRQFRDKRDN